ncbi:extracellular matrix regulator RemB [Desulfuribacillus alkaliarsenatis]|uniref:DUF370 domain-containing protein n=1 Tax=Desulfuribacillus alkaliarsenatis TaxID=766136 RepID=A0A1E5G2W4_9FIRM|nr:extracellular matrix/biofilm biosynthesis regulator RemA family protein [Desulfuribacillus alkaliarsenatis]OEF97310.1 DUF370 domain-containing protein [Desulfuribacillus alkaliarsenatis]
MFIHLGANVLIPIKDVIAIIDVKMKDTADSMKEFLDVADEEGFVVKIEDGEIKSYVITTKNVYFSPISSVTLKKRSLYMGSL